MKKWHGLMKILDISHHDKNGNIIYKEENIHNILHRTGEELILSILFSGLTVPENYYIGLDSRSSLSASDSIGSIMGYEPNENSYSRQEVANDSFSIIVNSSSSRQANSPTILFKAVGGSWGPVRNIFLTTNLGYGTNSKLISSAALSQPITLQDGEIVTLRMGMMLSGC